ncbi:gamma-aminobutyric acid type B receptor subunit 2-like [Diadema antillarum]|uniref:gamma-aminobutyric acid type B receptor subunit 2-like n=1 Tax=Diadema antillarum TaxID=105358 RepID=UPI003A88C82A
MFVSVLQKTARLSLLLCVHCIATSNWTTTEVHSSTEAQLPSPTSTSFSSSVSSTTGSVRKTPIYIGAFFPFEGEEAFADLPDTVQTAIDHVNELPGFLDNYQLRMRWNWTNGSPAAALQILNDFVTTGPPIVMVWGPFLSGVATVLNEVVPQYNLVQVTMASSSTLKDRAHYPLTVQTTVDEDVYNPARVAFVRAMGWKRVAAIFEDTEYFRENTKQLTLLLHQADITVLATEAVTELDSVDVQIESLKRHDARIIFAGFLPNEAAVIFCKAFRLNLYGPKIVWIVPGWYHEDWWKVTDPEVIPCSSEDLKEVLQYHIGFDGDQLVPAVDLINFNGLKPLPHHLEYLQTVRAMKDNGRVIYAYDSLITLALILNASVVELEQRDARRPGDDEGLGSRNLLEDFSYDDAAMSEILLKNAHKVSFTGLTDKVEIAEEGVRNSLIYVEQFVGNTTMRVKAYSHWEGSLTPLENRSLRWAGGYTPVDGVTVRMVPETVSTTVRYVFYALSGCGAVLALLFLSLNIHFREYRSIKISSPTLNNLIIVGCLILYSSVIIPGLDSTSFDDRRLIVLCNVHTGLISIGISLALGSLFGKTYRIHAIFTKAVKKLQKIDLPDSKLITCVCSLVLADLAILTMRVFLDEFYVSSHALEPKLDETDPEKEIYNVATVRRCASTNHIYFRVVLYGIKGILLMFGIFLAWETRDVTVTDLNDSHYIALSVYTVAVTMAVAVPTLTMFVYRVDLSFIIFSCAILVANTVVLCLVFVPKVWPLLRNVSVDRTASVPMSHRRSSTVRLDRGGTARDTNTFHFQSADEGIQKLSLELEQKRRLLKSLSEELQRLDSAVSA